MEMFTNKIKTFRIMPTNSEEANKIILVITYKIYKSIKKAHYKINNCTLRATFRGPHLRQIV